MSSTSKIEWTDATWSPLTGCTHCSPGCDNCYAAREASGRLKNHPAYKGLAVGGKFTGEVRLLPDRLEQPLHWRKPRRVFVNSMSDLFHPDVPVEFIAEVFAVMSLATAHTFQILTKRPKRMAAVLAKPTFAKLIENRRYKRHIYAAPFGGHVLPLPNVWLGTSVENQRYADMRIPHLLATPATVRFLSVEPLLGPVDLRAHLAEYVEAVKRRGTPAAGPRIDWVIVGGESGRGARPMHPEWARAIRDQCEYGAVPFLFKQWGEWTPTDLLWRDVASTGSAGSAPEWGIQVDRGYAIVEPEWACGVAYERNVVMQRVGKKAAGRVLDGRTWDLYPACPIAL